MTQQDYGVPVNIKYKGTAPVESTQTLTNLRMELLNTYMDIQHSETFVPNQRSTYIINIVICGHSKLTSNVNHLKTHLCLSPRDNFKNNNNNQYNICIVCEAWKRLFYYTRMLKKTDNSSQRRDCPKKTSIQCSVCNISSTKTAFYVRDSGHIVCENCHQSDGRKSRQDSGDFVIEKTCPKHTKTSITNRQQPSSLQTKDFASGDHDKRNKTSIKERKSKSAFKINACKDHVETKSSSANKIEAKKEIETIIEYKNINYRDKSSTCSLITATSPHAHSVECNTELLKFPDSHVCPRWYQYLILEFFGPVKCPVEECNKMIAINAVMLHFYFDHSKVPRMNLNASVSRVLQLKPINLSLQSQCLGIVLLQESNDIGFCPKVESGIINSSDYKSLLLMGAKIQTDKIKNRDEKSYTKPVSVRNICTQTEKLRKDTSIIKKNSTLSIKRCESYKSVAQNIFDNNELLLLWLCKQDSNTNSYSISILRRDKKQGYNYIGEAIYIRNEQSPAEMFQRADCLIVSGTALNRLLDDKGQISVHINILE